MRTPENAPRRVRKKGVTFWAWGSLRFLPLCEGLGSLPPSPDCVTVLPVQISKPVQFRQQSSVEKQGFLSGTQSLQVDPLSGEARINSESGL